MAHKVLLGDHCGQPFTDLSVRQAQKQFLSVLIATVIICITIEVYFTYNRFVFVPPPVGKQGPRLLTVDCKGRRLGNLMFNYAALLGISKHNNMTPVFPGDIILRDVFEAPMRVGYHDENFGMYHSHREFGGRSCAYDRTTENLPNFNIRLYGYYQSWKYFDSVKDELRKHFTFRTEVESRAVRYLDSIIPVYKHKLDVVRVGVHVRRGDMTTPYFINYGYVTADAPYLKRAIDYFRKRFTKVIFIVCSDDIDWCKDNISGSDVVFSESGDMLVDLFILTQCQHTVMTVGSFGWWAAWLTNGTTVYYKDWPRPVSQLEYVLDRKAYFMPNWIPM